MIGITQPRRVAAITIAERVPLERNIILGTLFMKDGILLRESISNPLFLRYSVIILDDTHERIIHTDILFGIVKSAQMIREKQGMSVLKLITMSATMDVDHFSQYFNNAPVYFVKGSQYNVECVLNVLTQLRFFGAIEDKEKPKKEEISEIHSKIESIEGDHIMLLNIFRAYKLVKGNKIISFLCLILLLPCIVKERTDNIMVIIHFSSIVATFVFLLDDSIILANSIGLEQLSGNWSRSLLNFCFCIITGPWSLVSQLMINKIHVSIYTTGILTVMNAVLFATDFILFKYLYNNVSRERTRSQSR